MAGPAVPDAAAYLPGPVVGRPQPSRWLVTLPVGAAAVALTSAAPVLFTPLLVFGAVPALATAGDLLVHRARATWGIQDGWADRQGAGTAGVARFARNLVVSAARSLPVLAALAVLIAVWYPLHDIGPLVGLSDWYLRAVGLGVGLLVVVPALRGSATFASGIAVDEVHRRVTPSGRGLNQAGIILWLVCLALAAIGLLASPEVAPLGPLISAGAHAELPVQEGEHVGGLVGLPADRLALAVAGLGLDPHQHRVLVRRRRSRPGWRPRTCGRGRRRPGCRPRPSSPAAPGSRCPRAPGRRPPVVRRVGVQPGEVLGLVGVAVLGHPQAGDEERGKRTMSVSGTAQCTARHRSGRWVMVAATSRPPLLPPRMASRSRRGAALGDQPVGGGREVVEHLLLVAAHAGAVPVLALLGRRRGGRRPPTARRRRSGRRRRRCTPGSW